MRLQRRVCGSSSSNRDSNWIESMPPESLWSPAGSYRKNQNRALDGRSEHSGNPRRDTGGHCGRFNSRQAWRQRRDHVRNWFASTQPDDGYMPIADSSVRISALRDAGHFTAVRWDVSIGSANKSFSDDRGASGQPCGNRQHIGPLLDVSFHGRDNSQSSMER